MSILEKEVTLGDTVRVRNLGSEPLRWAWNLKQFIVPPGEDGFVPFDLMKMQCGDPRASHHSATIKDDYNGLMLIPRRADEVNRLMQLHPDSTINGTDKQGNRVNPFRSFLPEDRNSLPSGVISDNAPQVEVYDLHGNRIWTVLDDPFGDRVSAARPVQRDTEFQSATLRQQSNEIMDLRKMVAVMAEKLGINPDQLVPTEPSPAPSAALEAPDDGVVTESPSMAFDPRTRKIKHRSKTPEPADPTSLEEGPEDE